MIIYVIILVLFLVAVGILVFKFQKQDCEGSFGNWSSCNSDGNQERMYTITKEKENKGKDCEFANNYKEVRKCLFNCEQTFGTWSTCDISTSKRERSVTVIHEAKNGGRTCLESPHIQFCVLEDYPIEYKWIVIHNVSIDITNFKKFSNEINKSIYKISETTESEKIILNNVSSFVMFYINNKTHNDGVNYSGYYTYNSLKQSFIHDLLTTDKYANFFVTDINQNDPSTWTFDHLYYPDGGDDKLFLKIPWNVTTNDVNTIFLKSSNDMKFTELYTWYKIPNKIWNISFEPTNLNESDINTLLCKSLHAFNTLGVLYDKNDPQKSYYVNPNFNQIPTMSQLFDNNNYDIYFYVNSENEYVFTTRFPNSEKIETIQCNEIFKNYITDTQTDKNKWIVIKNYKLNTDVLTNETAKNIKQAMFKSYNFYSSSAILVQPFNNSTTTMPFIVYNVHYIMLQFDRDARNNYDGKFRKEDGSYLYIHTSQNITVEDFKTRFGFTDTDTVFDFPFD